MSSDALQSLIVIVAVIGAMVYARFLASTAAGRRPAPTAGAAPVLPAPQPAGPVPPQPVPGATAGSTEAVGATRQRRRPRVNLVDARTGIVLAAILGPCPALRDEEPS